MMKKIIFLFIILLLLGWLMNVWFFVCKMVIGVMIFIGGGLVNVYVNLILVVNVG